MVLHGVFVGLVRCVGVRLVVCGVGFVGFHSWLVRLVVCGVSFVGLQSWLCRWFWCVDLQSCFRRWCGGTDGGYLGMAFVMF